MIKLKFQANVDPELYPSRSIPVVGDSAPCKDKQQFDTSPRSGWKVNFSAVRLTYFIM